MNRSEKLSELKNKFADLIDLPWSGRRYPGCYDVIQKYFAKYHPDKRTLADFSALKIYSFNQAALDAENGVYAWKSAWGDMLDFEVIQEHDLMLYRVYTDPLIGGYSVPVDRAPNHGAIYLGNGFILHQLYKETSEICNITHGSYSLYQTACVGGVR